jgi:hypothetical protein
MQRIIDSVSCIMKRWRKKMLIAFKDILGCALEIKKTKPYRDEIFFQDDHFVENIISPQDTICGIAEGGKLRAKKMHSFTECSQYLIRSLSCCQGINPFG